MKILGYTYYAPDRTDWYLKPDSALLVNGKPFFLPAFSEDIVAHPCLIARISRMGRNIAERFAERYYDAVALGLNFQTREAQQSGNLADYMRSVSFDNAFAVGTFAAAEGRQYALCCDEKKLELGQTVVGLNHAIAELSRYITLRNGDMIGVDFVAEPIVLRREMLLEGYANETQAFRCRIK